jgi:hypothetical protein
MVIRSISALHVPSIGEEPGDDWRGQAFEQRLLLETAGCTASLQQQQQRHCSSFHNMIYIYIFIYANGSCVSCTLCKKKNMYGWN